MITKLTLEVKGRETEDIEYALEEVARLIRAGYRNGYNTSGLTSIRFGLEELSLGDARKDSEKKARG